MFVQNSLPDASIIRVPGSFVPWHYGILFYGPTVGDARVVHALKERGVCETSLTDFAGEFFPEMTRSAPLGYRDIVYRRAYSQIGRPYDLFDANCEHFVNWVFDGVPRSDQLRAVGLTVAAIIGFAWLKSNSRQPLL